MKNVIICPVCQGTAFQPIAHTEDFTITREKFQIVRCTGCTLGITTPRPAELEKYYQSPDYISHTGKAASIIDSIYLIARRFTLKWKHSLLREINPGNTLLDYGCGTGDFLKFMSEKGYFVNGVEPSEPARKRANEKLKSEIVFPEIRGVGNQFDIVTLWHVLEHVPDLNGTLQELKQMIKPGGHLIIAVPNLNSWDSTHYKTFWAGYDTPRHLWHFTQNSIKSLLANNGLKVIQTRPMILDAYYISLLSEKYIRSQTTFGGMINAFFTGQKSNQKAKKTGEYSSLIYIIQNENQ